MNKQATTLGIRIKPRFYLARMQHAGALSVGSQRHYPYVLCGVDPQDRECLIGVQWVYFQDAKYPLMFKTRSDAALVREFLGGEIYETGSLGKPDPFNDQQWTGK